MAHVTIDPAREHATPVATMSWRDRPRTGILVVTALVMAAAVVTSIGIQTPWPWSDEGATYLAVQRSWTELAVLWQSRDAPLVPYYYLAKAWATIWAHLAPAVPTLVVVRLLSAAAATATVPVLYALVARNAGRLAGTIAAVLLLSFPGFIRYAQEARPYALMVLAATVAWLVSDRHLRPAASGFRVRPGAAGAHAAGLAAVGAIHTFGLCQWPAHLLAAALAPGDRRDRFRRTASVVVVLLVAGALVGAQVIASLGHGTGPIGADSERAVTWFTVPGEVLRGISLTPLILASVVVVGLALVGALSRPGGRRDFPLSLVIWQVVPLALAIGVGAVRTNLFRIRYWVAFLPPLAALAALGVVAIAAVVVRLATALASGPGSSGAAGPGSLALRAAFIMPICALLVLQVTIALPAQVRVRVSVGHGENLAGVRTALADARVRHPGVRAAISAASVSGTLAAVEPGLLGENPLRRLDPAARSVYTTANSPATVRQRLAGATHLLWIHDGPLVPAELPVRLPRSLARLNPVVIEVRPAGPGWTTVLLQLPG